jgi:TolB protein
MPAWSPHGDKIVYNGVDGLYIMNADGTGQPELVRRDVGRGTIVDPTWSPDGSKIAFHEGKIYILDLETRQAVPLMDDSIRGFEPTWSPDGTKIAFTLDPSPRSNASDWSIAVIKVDGSGLMQLTANDNSRSPEWSPDGSRIVFEREDNIYVMNADGTNIRALTQDGKSIFPTWSQDSTRIAFVSLVNRKCGVAILDASAFCTSELRVMNADGSNLAVIRAESNENVLYPAWAPRN